MNNFTTPNSTSTTPIPKHLETLTTSVFQSLFPPISPQQTPLRSIRRVLLLNREAQASTDQAPEEDGTYIINLRHYAITTKPIVSLSRGLKRLRAAEQHAKPPSTLRTPKNPTPTPPASTKKSRSAASLPNLSRLDDVADYILDPAAAGYTSASETEADTDAEVEVLEPEARRVTSRQRSRPGRGTGANAEADSRTRKRQNGPPPVQRRAVRLTEIGPRLKLRLVKVQEGMCEGKVMWHEFVQKSEEEVRGLDEVWEGRRKEREERRRVQRENVERKRKDKGKGEEGDEVDEEEDEYFDVDDDEWDDEMDEDAGGVELEDDDDDQEMHDD